MAKTTEISWADATFNPFIGCTKVGPGCDHCYAERDNERRKWVEGWGPGAPRRRTSQSYWRQPLAWDRRAREAGRPLKVFCASLADVFDNEVPDEWRADLFALIRATPNLRWMLLTKRIGNAAKMLPRDWPYPNAGLMATVVNQAEADRDVPKLLKTPATWRGLSIEPMIGPVNLTRIMRQERAGDATEAFCDDALTGFRAHKCGGWLGPRLDWIIVGGESGPQARPMSVHWARELRDQCAGAEVPFFFKQWGEWLPWAQFMSSGIEDDPERTRFDTMEFDGIDWIDVGRPMWCDTFDGNIDDENCVGRVGRRKAGWLLDGVEHKNFPAALAA